MTYRSFSTDPPLPQKKKKNDRTVHALLIRARPSTDILCLLTGILAHSRISLLARKSLLTHGYPRWFVGRIMDIPCRSVVAGIDICKRIFIYYSRIFTQISSQTEKLNSMKTWLSTLFLPPSYKDAHM